MGIMVVISAVFIGSWIWDKLQRFSCSAFMAQHLIEALMNADRANALSSAGETPHPALARHLLLKEKALPCLFAGITIFPKGRTGFPAFASHG
jgi:hypothetical protein